MAAGRELKKLDKNSDRYACIFANLMERSDCRKYFLDKINSLMDSVFSEEYSMQLLEEMLEERNTELRYMYEHFENLKKSGDDSLWSSYYDVAGRLNRIKAFIINRRKYIEKYINNCLT